MAATASSAKLSYKVTNWRAYNESLVRRGDITFWFNEDVIDAWEHDNAQWKVGRPFTYSNLAIQTLLSMRELFRLTYRQTESFGRAVAKLMQADVAIPDYTSLQKRAAKLGVSISFNSTEGPIDVVVDSTGLKVYGEGEYVRRTGNSLNDLRANTIHRIAGLRFGINGLGMIGASISLEPSPWSHHTLHL
jgi:hypothetical protein